MACSVGVSRAPEVDLSWTGLLPGDPTGIGWRGSAIAVAIVSFFIVSFYSLAIVWIVRYKRRRKLVIKIITSRPGMCGHFAVHVVRQYKFISYRLIIIDGIHIVD